MPRIIRVTLAFEDNAHRELVRHAMPERYEAIPRPKTKAKRKRRKKKEKKKIPSRPCLGVAAPIVPCQLRSPFNPMMGITGAMRRCEPRCSLYQLRRLSNRMQDPPAQEEEDPSPSGQGFR
ncbi:hypothetical protein F4810DRAFT_446888 [Camillea tinctor]|nr:hypothetical protein F4810DRAFT_446888 [Camillea tinctor]